MQAQPTKLVHLSTAHSSSPPRPELTKYGPLILREGCEDEVKRVRSPDVRTVAGSCRPRPARTAPGRDERAHLDGGGAAGPGARGPPSAAGPRSHTGAHPSVECPEAAVEPPSRAAGLQI